ncbi:hypothetical protein N7524_008536 [Penicillium chrysogenum]|nr:hypothetical protein N7524_008536 [Penicillium chrysogenum]
MAPRRAQHGYQADAEKVLILLYTVVNVGTLLQVVPTINHSGFADLEQFEDSQSFSLGTGKLVTSIDTTFQRTDIDPVGHLRLRWL